MATNPDTDRAIPQALTDRLAAQLGIEPEQAIWIRPLPDERVNCGRCGGTGSLSEYAYNGGVCYSCDGEGVIGYRSPFQVSFTASVDGAEAMRAYLGRQDAPWARVRAGKADPLDALLAEPAPPATQEVRVY